MSLNQKSNRDDWFWVWMRRNSEGNVVGFERYHIKNFASTEKHEGINFIFHKPTNVEGFDNWMYTEVKSGASAATSPDFTSCRELFKEYKKKRKVDILIDIARAKKRINQIEEEWKENQNQ